MAVKPWKKLLEEADTFLGVSSMNKSAAASSDDGVANLAEDLINAGALEKVASSMNTTSVSDTQFEKMALALNRAEAAAQIKEMHKIAAFRQKALSEGVSINEVEEEIEKIAAKKLKASLTNLTALSAGIFSKDADKSGIEPKKVPANEVGQAAHQRDTTESVG